MHAHICLIHQDESHETFDYVLFGSLAHCRLPLRASVEVAQQITRQLAMELGEENIRVNAISAGPVNTLSARGIKGLGGMLKHYARKSSLKRNITQEEVGKAALFLLSDMSSGAV